MPAKHPEKPANDKNNFFSSPSFLFFLVLAAIAIAFFIWHQTTLRKATDEHVSADQKITQDIAVPEQIPSPITNLAIPELQQDTVDESQRSPEEIISIAQEQADSSKSPGSSTKSEGTPATGGRPVQPFKTQEEDTASQAISTTPDAGKELTVSRQCLESARIISGFYSHLDKQSYLENHRLQPNSELYFTMLMQRLLDNPPVVSGETHDLYTILQNTAHFFRIIGSDNITILKKILSNEQDWFEKILSEYYSLIQTRSCPKQTFDLQISDSALYEYAGFFLSTMGGRLYLFRRDSKSRMVISYYAILLIDAANKNGTNKHGIEIGTTIDLLVSEMESTTNTLEFKDRYLDRLYSLQEQYQ